MWIQSCSGVRRHQPAAYPHARRVGASPVSLHKAGGLRGRWMWIQACREALDRPRRPGRASKPGNARALVHFGPSACHRGERGSEKIGFPETATGVRLKRTFGNVPEAR